MKTWKSALVVAGLVIAGVLLGLFWANKAGAAGPNGGDVVSLGGDTNAEMLANSDSGEIMVHTWNRDLNSPKPIEATPLTLGSDEKTVRLDPHPVTSDPQGYCSRFYGQADWVRGGGVAHGWMSRAGNESQRSNFAWSRCWKAGGGHSQMWSEMGGHGGMGPGGAGGMRHE